MLSHYLVEPGPPMLSPREHRATLAFAEAILPGSSRTPGADEATVARTAQMLHGFGPGLLRGWIALVEALDQSARLATGRPFHALSREAQDRTLLGWEQSAAMRGLLRGLVMPLGMAHFDRPSTYRAMGGTLRVLGDVEVPRWESRIQRAADWTSDRDLECDVVVVGTGAGGAVVGRELADRGHAVVFVEQGKRHRRDEFVGSFVHAQKTFYGSVVALGGNPFPVLMGRLVGGSTVINGGTCLRTPSFVLDEWCEHLDADDLSPARMAPFFERVEQRLSVSEPERRHIGPIADVFDRGGRALGWRVGAVPRNAVGCEGEGFCDHGCASGARRSADVAYLAGALERGALVLSELAAERVLIEGGRAVGVEAFDRGGRRFRVRARAVVLAGGAVSTPALLLRQGIANTSGEVGKNLSVHPSVGAGAQFDERLDPERHIPQGYMLTQFVREGILVLAAQPDLTIAHLMFPFTGARLARAIDALPHLAMFGLLIRDDSRGRVRVGPGGKTAVTYRMGAADVERLRRATIHTADLCWAAGARRIYTGLLGVDPIDSRGALERFRRRPTAASDFAVVAYHPLGTCRMGRDPRRSVVGLDHQSHDVPGLFVVDGSTVPGPPGVNPQITIMAMATRAAEHIATSL